MEKKNKYYYFLRNPKDNKIVNYKIYETNKTPEEMKKICDDFNAKAKDEYTIHEEITNKDIIELIDAIIENEKFTPDKFTTILNEIYSLKKDVDELGYRVFDLATDIEDEIAEFKK